MKKRPRQVKETVQGPEYRDQEIYPANDQVNGEKDMDYDEGSDDNSEPITVGLGTITS